MSRPPDDDWMDSPWYWLLAAVCCFAAVVFSVFYPWGFAAADAGRYMDSAPLVAREGVTFADRQSEPRVKGARSGEDSEVDYSARGGRRSAPLI